jgi:hypothetical protein
VLPEREIKPVTRWMAWDGEAWTLRTRGAIMRRPTTDALSLLRDLCGFSRSNP